MEEKEKDEIVEEEVAYSSTEEEFDEATKGKKVIVKKDGRTHNE